MHLYKITAKSIEYLFRIGLLSQLIKIRLFLPRIFKCVSTFIFQRKPHQTIVTSNKNQNFDIVGHIADSVTEFTGDVQEV